jgi:hypothetical protein
MKVTTFMDVLKENRGKELKFMYRQNGFVAPGYHLTEVKNVQFDTTDCGGKRNFWEETHLQLWENPEESDKESYMTTNKILSILEKVDGINPLKGSTEVKIEYGNEGFNTGVMPIDGFEISDSQVLVKLFEEGARCKANESCGILDKVDKVEEPCCATNACC